MKPNAKMINDSLKSDIFQRENEESKWMEFKRILARKRINIFKKINFL